MKKLLGGGIGLGILALIFSIWPSLTAYLNTDYIDVRQFLIDHPKFFWPMDIALWLMAAACFALYFILRKRAVTFVQASLEYGEGAKALEKLLDTKFISSRVITIEDSFSSDSPAEEDVEMP